jgi:hypothetical protein
MVARATTRGRPTRLRQLVAERGVRYHRVAAGDSLAGLGGVGGLVLHPNADYVDSSGASAYGRNNGSVAMRLDYGARVLRTDQHGAVRVVIDGAQMQVETMLQPTSTARAVR